MVLKYPFSYPTSRLGKRIRGEAVAELPAGFAGVLRGLRARAGL